ncbi:hypothetical protein SprV_0100414500 [Sparganum proliferum]
MIYPAATDVIGRSSFAVPPFLPVSRFFCEHHLASSFDSLMLTAIRNTLRLDRRQLTAIRRRSLFFSFLCSGVAYRAYSRSRSVSGDGDHETLLPFAQSTTATLLLQTQRHLPALGQLTVFFADNRSPDSTKSGQGDSKRLDRLFALHHWVETQLPYLFNRRLFDSTGELFDPDTVLEVERSNGSVTRFRGRPRANIFLAAVRSYFAATSYQRRIDLLGVHADPKVGEIEAHFRVVLLPSPTSSDRLLPHDQLALRLEQKAKWHDFRAIFCLSKSGVLTTVRLTQLTPPQKPSISLTLQRLRLIRNFVPSLSSGGRRLPQPLPCISNMDATSAATTIRAPITAGFPAPYASDADCSRTLASAIRPLLASSQSPSVVLARTRPHYPLWRLYQQRTDDSGGDVPIPTPLGSFSSLRPLRRQWRQDRAALLSSCPLLLASITACSQCLT